MNKAITTIRELTRHLLFTTGTYGLLERRRAREGRNTSHLEEETLKSRFAAVYGTGVWQHGKDREAPGSGAGSTLDATKGLRGALPGLLDSLKARTLIDVGCGDFTWMQNVNISQDYIGLDVVDSVIASNNGLYHRGNRQFLVADATVDDIPEGDVVMCREVLFHLSFADIRMLLTNIVAKKRAYILATSDRQTLFNSNIPSGDFRLLNLEAWPFKFPRPDRVIADDSVSKHRVLGIWTAESIRKMLA